ncbi:MAG: hypothetical protein JF596_09295 [Stenotrophomonas sp.]|nr:hypothetical protein [Stenotrophomonas sp.]
MPIELRYADVIDFLRTHALLGMTAEQRAQSLVELAHWERTIAALTGAAIRITDHADASLVGLCCPACTCLVFTDEEDAFFEICPVCLWQNDGTAGDEYSGCNHVTMSAFRTSADFTSRVQAGTLLYLQP